MSDLISRQALQEWIKDKTFGDIVVASEHNFDCLPSVEPERKDRECASCKHSNNGECAFTEECHLCMWESQYEQRVEPERKIGKWIPVSDKVPELDGYYLTSTMYGQVYCDYWSDDHFNRTETVIAWMTLPQPYKTESKDSEVIMDDR